MSMLHQTLAQSQQARAGKKKNKTNEEIDDISHKLSTKDIFTGKYIAGKVN
jgi:hypothetical protein